MGILEVVLVSTTGKASEVESYLVEFRKRFLPNRILTVVSEGQDLELHSHLVPLAKEKLALNGKTAAYVCENGTCRLPATTPALFA